MSSEKSLAIVLRTIEFSETSLVVTLMTREFGKITAIAKGARRKKSPFEGALDVLAICRIVFLHKSSGAMDLLTEAKLEKRFRSASTDLQRLYCAYYVTELLAKTTDDSDPHPELFDLAQRTIEALDTESCDSFRILLRFEMRMLSLLGHQPMLSQCVRCGNDSNPDQDMFFGLIDGGCLCGDCRPGKTNVIRVAGQSVKLLRTMMNDNEDWASIQLESVNRGEVRQLLNRYVAHLIGKPPRMHAFIKNLIQ